MPSTFTAGKNTINLGIFIKKLFPNCHLQKLLDYGQKKNFFFFLACWSFYGQLKTISNYRSGNIKLVVQFLQFIVCSLFVVAILQVYCGHIHLHLVLLVGCRFFFQKKLPAVFYINEFENTVMVPIKHGQCVPMDLFKSKLQPGQEVVVGGNRELGLSDKF